MTPEDHVPIDLSIPYVAFFSILLELNAPRPLHAQAR
jgi:hypothetical protein